MHAEKGKPGQYVGKVDANSPAELAGLREGDRIIEVNGTDIGSETHKQVVERIKVVPNETTLLVIDPHVFHVTKNGSPVIASSPVSTKEDKKMPSPVEQSLNNNNDASDLSTDKNVTTETKDNGAVSETTTTTTITTMENNNTKVSNETVMNSSSNNETVVDTTKTETGNHHVNNHHTKMTTDEPADATTTTTTTLVENNNHDKNHENNSSAANGKQHTETTESKSATNGSVLNLNMTATELRAKLMAKKKYDPKNDSIDLRKKYDIIEKM